MNFGFLDRDEEFQSAFAEIRAAIDKIVGPWRHLPDPRAIATVVENCRSMTIGLAGTSPAAGGEALGVGKLPGYIAVLNQSCRGVSGRTIGTFKSKLIFQLGDTIGGCTQFRYSGVRSWRQSGECGRTQESGSRTP